MTARRQTTSGFTIVEVIVIISVLAILVGITYFFVGDWRSRAATNEVKSDLNGAASALENVRNFGSGYPAALTDDIFKSTNTVTLDYTRRGDGSYCLNATSQVRTNVKWYVDSRTDKQPASGTCS